MSRGISSRYLRTGALAPAAQASAAAIHRRAWAARDDLWAYAQEQGLQVATLGQFDVLVMGPEGRLVALRSREAIDAAVAERG